MQEFKTMDISFCERKAQNIIKSDAKSFILDYLKTKYNISISDKYALMLNDRSIKYISMNPHLISLKTTGSNYYLFLTKLNDVNTCLFIDRKVKHGYTLPRIISVKYRFDDTLFNDTLFDGELVKDKNNNWMFLIQNMLVCKGELQKCNVVTKYNKMYKLFSDDYVSDPNIDICVLKIKKLFKYDEYDELITRFIPSMSYNIRGMYFNTLNNKHANYLFIYNTTNALKNKKLETKNTDSYSNNRDKEKVIQKKETNKKDENSHIKKDTRIFQLKKSEKPEIYDLFAIHNNQLTKYGIAYVSGLKASRNIKKMLNTCPSPIVECVYNNNFNKYEPLKVSEENISLFSELK